MGVRLTPGYGLLVLLNVSKQWFCEILRHFGLSHEKFDVWPRSMLLKKIPKQQIHEKH